MKLRVPRPVSESCSIFMPSSMTATLRLSGAWPYVFSHDVSRWACACSLSLLGCESTIVGVASFAQKCPGVRLRGQRDPDDLAGIPERRPPHHAVGRQPPQVQHLALRDVDRPALLGVERVLDRVVVFLLDVHPVGMQGDELPDLRALPRHPRDVLPGVGIAPEQQVRLLHLEELLPGLPAVRPPQDGVDRVRPVLPPALLAREPLDDPHRQARHGPGNQRDGRPDGAHVERRRLRHRRAGHGPRPARQQVDDIRAPAPPLEQGAQWIPHHAPCRIRSRCRSAARSRCARPPATSSTAPPHEASPAEPPVEIHPGNGSYEAGRHGEVRKTRPTSVACRAGGGEDNKMQQDNFLISSAFTKKSHHHSPTVVAFGRPTF